MKCTHCGKVIEPDAKSIRISEVETIENRSRPKVTTWGSLHEGCFYKTVRSPKAALRRLKMIHEDCNE